MDPLTASISIILGKYALDKGADLVKEVGPTALENAKEIVVAALDRLRRIPADKVIADEYEKDPETYQKPLEKKLEAVMQADPAFAAKLKSLFEAYEAAAQEYAAAEGRTYQATITGAGSLAQGEGATAATATGGSIAVGSVGGNVTVGQKSDKDSE